LEASIDFAGMGAVMKSARSVLLWQALRGAHVHLGWGAIGGDWACDRMVAARVIEPADSRTVCVPFRDLIPPHLMRHTSIPGPVPGRAAE